MKRKSPTEGGAELVSEQDSSNSPPSSIQRQQNSRSVDEFVHALRAACGKSAEAYLEFGRLAEEAKAELPYGAWEEMCTTPGRLPYEKRSVERHMAIARNKVLANPAFRPLLPPHWRTAYEMTKFAKKFGDAALQAKFENGEFAQSTQQKDVVALLRADKPPKPKRATPLQAARSIILQQAAHIEELEAARDEPELQAPEQDQDPLEALREAKRALEIKAMALEGEVEDLRRENAQLKARLEASKTTE